MDESDTRFVLAVQFDEIRGGKRKPREGELQWLAESFCDVLRRHSGALRAHCAEVGVADHDRILLLLSGVNTTALSVADRKALEVGRPIADARRRFADRLELLLPAPGDMRAVRWWPRVQVKGRRRALVRLLPEVRGEILHIRWASPLVRTAEWLEAAFELTAYAAGNYRPVRDRLPDRRARRESAQERPDPAWLARVLQDLMDGSTSQSPD